MRTFYTTPCIRIICRYIFLELRSHQFIVQKLKINIVIYLLIQLYLCICGSRKYYIVRDNKLLCEKLEKLIRMGLKKGLTLR